MLEEAGEHLHESPLERPLLLGDVRPALHALGARSQLRLGRDPAGGLLPGEDPLPVGVPAVVEGPGVLVGPFLGDVVRSVRGTGSPVHEKRAVGGVRAVLTQPGDRVVGQVLGQVVALALRRLDRIEVLIQPRLPLRGFAGDEPIEIVEAVPGGPTVERSHRGGLVAGSCATCRTPPCSSRSGPAPRRRDGVLADHPGVAVPVHSAFGDRAGVHAMVVAAGQQRRTGRGTDRGGVEGVVADAVFCYSPESRRTHLPAHHIGQAEPDIVEQNDEDVRRVLRQVLRLDATVMGRFGQCVPGRTGRRGGRKREGRSVGRATHRQGPSRCLLLDNG